MIKTSRGFVAQLSPPLLDALRFAAQWYREENTKTMQLCPNLPADIPKKLSEENRVLHDFMESTDHFKELLKNAPPSDLHLDFPDDGTKVML